jgi:hypothetical protein
MREIRTSGSVGAAGGNSRGDPTAGEQLVLEMINRARANPDAEGTRLSIDIHEGLDRKSVV